MNKTFKRIAVLLMILATLVGIVYAAVYVYSNPVEVAIGEQPTIHLNEPTGDRVTGQTLTFTGTSTGLPAVSIVELCNGGVPTGDVTTLEPDGSFAVTWTAKSGIHIFTVRVDVS